MAKQNKGAPPENRDEWQTPSELFRLYDSEYHFDLDAAASKENHLCPYYFTEEDSALSQDWNIHDTKTVWMNPPFSNPLQHDFLKAAYEQSQKHDLTVVCLIPVATETERWVETVTKATEIHMLYPRVNYIHPLTKKKVSGVRWPSAIVIFRGYFQTYPIVKWRNWKTGEFVV